MFTLKLYRRLPHLEGRQEKVTRVVQAHHVQVQEIGKTGCALELWAFDGPEPSDYTSYYIGEPEPGMDAFGKPTHLDHGDHSWWGWGLLENSQGKTTEHYRPASYG